MVSLSAAIGFTLSGCSAGAGDEDPAGQGDELIAVAEQAAAADGQVCLTIQRDGHGSVPDATIWQNAPGWVDGAAATVLTGTSSAGPRRAVLQLGLTSIPQGATVTSASLSVFGLYKSTEAAVNVHPLTAPWTEATATWNSLGSAFDGTPVGSFAVPPASPGFRAVDVLGLVQAWIDGAIPNHGLVLDEISPLSSTSFRSSESPYPTERPKLDVCYVTCDDGIQNGEEQGVDCGGPKCAPCCIPAPEVCDGLDNDCDGQLDEDDPGGGAACATGQEGACSAGTTVCSGGQVLCTATTPAAPETCNGVDDNCDGVVDNSLPGCATAQLAPVTLVGGDSHSLALRSDGTVWTWGGNGVGQLGDGTTSLPRTTPQKVHGMTSVTAVAAGAFHSLAARSDGTVWAWGENQFGQLGDGSTVPVRTTPVQVATLTNVTGVAAGFGHSLAIRSDGTVWAWGFNWAGQLGDGTTTDRTTPAQVSGLTGVIAVDAGHSYSLAVRSDGTVWAWGFNWAGQLGDGTTTERATPVQVSGLTGVTAVAAGAHHALAVRSDGTVWAWGYNGDGQLGDGTTTDRTTPVQVSGLTSVTRLAAGDLHSLAIRADGTVWAWGDDLSFQLGDGTTTDHTTPVQVSALTGVTRIAAGARCSLAFRSDNTVWAWGHNARGQLGDGSHGTVRFTPVQTGGQAMCAKTTYLPAEGWACPASKVVVAGGRSHSLAVRSDGTVWAWGGNVHGQLGDGSDPWWLHMTPMQVPGLTSGSTVAAGDYHSLAVRSDGTVWAWGHNIFGQLGDGTTTDRTTPVQVSGMTGVTAVAAGAYHSLAVRLDGTVWAWGNNSSGRLGDGTSWERMTPVQVYNMTNVTAAAAGSAHSLAILSDGTVRAWGYNVAGQLGDGTTNERWWPVQVSGLTDVIAVAAGSAHSLALRSDGTVWAWGFNGDGQLGDGTTTNRTTPVQVAGLTNVTAIDTSGRHSLALRSGGTLWSWGYNGDGQLGDGTTTNRTTPVQISGLVGVTAAAAADVHSLAVRSDGTVWAWGENWPGHLGDGTTTHRTSPVQTLGF
ncbi:DNRLRE domain-containing protein [Sorangium cellulosum]|uniref:RCC1 domain-containing protein n=1 Tax=Sorangium cellulosum TaxID=56 RepID=UPI0013313962|nr:DNRLRE domain-containing protein [Sorangium cellulosum]